MITSIEKVDPNNLELFDETFEKAASIIKNGGLVAFPTETVYGLGASIYDKEALKKIFLAKGRPSDNPLIVHISDLKDLDNLISEKNEKADILIKEFWPGPLTLIFKKNLNILDEVTSGLPTIAIRFPENKIARKLIFKSGVPIAAPSANSSGKPSPTRASHVEFDLFGKIDMIINGGSSEYGLESTIVDVSEETPVLLRPGSITREMLSAVLGEIMLDRTVLGKTESENFLPKAPGMKYKHYSPKAKVTIIDGELELAAKKINELAEKSMFEDGVSKKIGILATKQSEHLYDSNKFLVLVVGDRDKEGTIASNLFKMLRKFDYYNVDLVFSEGFGESSVGMAIMNRLKKASGYNIISV